MDQTITGATYPKMIQTITGTTYQDQQLNPLQIKFYEFVATNEIIVQARKNGNWRGMYCPQDNIEIEWWLNLVNDNLNNNCYHILRLSENVNENIIDDIFNGINNIGRFSYLHNFINIFYALKLKMNTNEELKQLIIYFFPKYYNKALEWNPINIEPCDDQTLRLELGPLMVPLTTF